MSFDAADLAAFFDPDMPGYAVATFAGGVEVAGLFGSGYGVAMSMVSGSQPSFQAPSADLAAVAEGTALTINAVSYKVREV
ncbi:MAG TPA: hypothetical protein VFH22_05270, partial [Rhodocyclaceae bacterium]|nr:hypothetical protein [Rhodocyclaceae bacterium]